MRTGAEGAADPGAGTEWQQTRTLLRLVAASADFGLALVAAGVALFFLETRSAAFRVPFFYRPAALLLLLPAVWSYVLYAADLYALSAARKPCRWRRGRAVAGGGLVVFLLGWAAGVPAPVRIALAWLTLGGALYQLVLGSAVTRAVTALLVARGFGWRVVVVGPPARARSLADEWRARPLPLVRVTGVLSMGQPPVGDGGRSDEDRHAAATDAESLNQFLYDCGANAVLMTTALPAETRTRVARAGRKMGLTVWQRSPAAEEAGAGPTAGLRPVCEQPIPVWGRCVKEGMDLTVGALLLVALSPLLLVAAVLVRTTSPGPAFFRQDREGRRGVTFRMIKFRTMREGAEQEHPELNGKTSPHVTYKPEEDPRITRAGRFLRKSSLDELPQLWNVLRGDMSLVGPRPFPPYEARYVTGAEQRRRLAVKPGMTGLWQISGRSRIRSVDERVRLDLEYVDHWSVRRDLSILLRTVPAVLSARGAQ